jgi:dinuclear metal center YbgI/SA1388 family protein
MAITAKADLLVVHHGLFWNVRQPWIGPSYELIRLLIEHDVAVYSSHLPLDAHPRLGNNAGLCAALGFRHTELFFFERGRHLGLKTATKISRAELAARLRKAVGRATLIPGGPPVCRWIGIVTGAAGAQLRLAVDEGVDTFITGEGPHWTHALAEELRVNLIYGGHYATETFGVKSLAAHVARKFHLPWLFLDHPSGL